jgi:hypothetical protein
MNWKPVKNLRPDKIHSTPADADWAGSLKDPWGSAEAYMKKGFLPPLVICQAMAEDPPTKVTRNLQWIAAGAIQSVKHLELDTAILRKALRALARD